MENPFLYLTLGAYIYVMLPIAKKSKVIWTVVFVSVVVGIAIGLMI